MSAIVWGPWRMDQIQHKQSLFDSLDHIWPESLLEAIQREHAQAKRKLVVLDDDPTGSQTVHGLHLLSEWSVDGLAAELRQSDTFFVLTNSRSLSAPDARALAIEMGQNLRRAAALAEVDIAVVSRSDSTLRGHYPTEVDALAQGLGWEIDATILIPFFAAGGRYTIHDIHYVQQGEDLVPAAQTEFAQDRAFPFSHSLMPAYIEEKTAGNITAEQVVCIGLDVLRTQGPNAVTERLMAAPRGTAIVVNGADARDIEVFVMGLLQAESNGKRYIYRTAADFVRVRAGITVKPILAPDELTVDTHRGGLMIVGSHVAKSTEQLNHVLELAGVACIEIPVSELLNETSKPHTLATLRADIAEKLEAGQTVVVYTSRALQSGATPEETLSIGRAISDSICDIVRQLPAQPRFLIAKGGITSNDVATKGLGVKRAFVLGQLQPGVPVWQTGPESKFPGMSYVVYPGNVGSPQGLADAIKHFGV